MNVIFATFNVSMVVTVFAYALHANSEDLRFLRRRPRLLILSLLAMFVVTPALALAIVEAIDMSNLAKVAIVALSLSIIPPLMPKKFFGGEEKSYAIGLTVTTAVLAPVVIPLQVKFLGDLTNRPYGVPPEQVAGVVVGLVVVPLIVGLVFRRLWPGAAEKLAEPLPRIAGKFTWVALIVVMIAVIPKVWDFISVRTVLAMLLFNVGALAVGHLLGGPERDHATVLGFSCPSRHPSIAFTIAQWNYPGTDFAAAMTLLLIINGIVAPLYIKWQGRRAGAAAQPAS